MKRPRKQKLPRKSKHERPQKRATMPLPPKRRRRVITDEDEANRRPGADLEDEAEGLDIDSTPLLDAFESPESSLIARATYHHESQYLSVWLRKVPGLHESDTAEVTVCYTFGAVSRSLWDEFAASPSKGAFFNQRIRPFFHGVKDGE